MSTNWPTAGRGQLTPPPRPPPSQFTLDIAEMQPLSSNMKPPSDELDSPEGLSSRRASPMSSLLSSPNTPASSTGSPDHLSLPDDIGPTPRKLLSKSPEGSPLPRWSMGSGGGREKGKYMVVGVLSSALDLAKAAVAHDEQQAPPEKVLPYYKKAIRAINTVLKLLPEDVAETAGIRGHRDAYEGRVIQLQQAASSDMLSKDRRTKQQSRVPFEQLELDPEHPTERQPTDPLRRAYWVMRLVRETIITGGHLTPRLFVPKGVWVQVGVRFSGFAPKISALETVLLMTIDKVITMPLPADAEARRASAEVLRMFREQAHKMQTDLSRHFPFIVGVDPLSLAKAVSPKSNLGRFNSLVKNIGRNVKNSAAVAVERIGAGIQGKVMDDELAYYSQLVSEVCSKCQIFDTWLVHLQQQMDAGECDDMDELFMELHLVGSFMREVICAMILQDIGNLLDRYLRKMRKSFARMYWDEDYDVHDT